MRAARLDRKYYDQVNQDLLRRIPLTSQSILEIGCGTGALGQAFKEMKPTAYYVGVELQKEAGEQARERLDRVIIGNVEEVDLSNANISHNTYDCIVLGDVLEHLVNPQATLKHLCEYLDEKGTIVACIPNVQHWSVIRCLLLGRWPQEDSGIFDRTHLRWFTKHSIQEMLASCGLHVAEIAPRVFRPDLARAFVESIKPSLESFGINKDQLLEGCGPLQYVVTAQKKPNKAMHITGLTLRPQAGLCDVRMIMPLGSLASIPGTKISLSSETITLNTSIEEDSPKIFIWQRQLLTRGESFEKIKRLIRAGYIIVSEFDDDPDHWPLIAQNRHLNFTGVHAVQVSTSKLREKIAIHNPNIEVFENCIERVQKGSESKWEDLLLKKRRIRLLFAALNRENDWRPYISALNRTISADPELWEVDVVHDRLFYEAVNAQHKSYTPTCDYKTYLKKMQEAHVCFMPLIENQFNSMKSDLKYVESASMLTISVASPTVYSSVIEDGVTGFLFKSAEELESKLKVIQNSIDISFNVARSAQQWVSSNRLISGQVEKRSAWYRHLWDNRKELNDQLFRRVPEVAN